MPGRLKTFAKFLLKLLFNIFLVPLYALPVIFLIYDLFHLTFKTEIAALGTILAIFFTITSILFSASRSCPEADRQFYFYIGNDLFFCNFLFLICIIIKFSCDVFFNINSSEIAIQIINKGEINLEIIILGIMMLLYLFFVIVAVPAFYKLMM